MADEDRSPELPQRVRGAARAGPAPSAPPVLSEELRQRLRAAVTAERGEAIGQDRELAIEPERRVTATQAADSDLTAPVINRAVKPEPTIEPVKPQPTIEPVKPERTVAPAKLVKPGSAAGPKPGSVAAPKPGSAAAPKPGSAAAPKPGSAAKSKPGSAAKSKPRSAAKPAHGASANHKPVAVTRADPSARPRTNVPEKPVRRRTVTARLVASALVLIAAGSLGVTVTRYATKTLADEHTSTALQRQEAAVREQAATWVSQQVSRSAIVSCDQVMCDALEEAGFPSRNLRVLGPTAINLLSSDVVVATPTVRSQFGSSLSYYWAPPVLATIGSGDAQITIRVVVADEAAAYQADLKARKQIGGDLASQPGVTASPTAKNQLITGQVDSRLLLAIATLAAANEPIDIVQFETIGPGVDPHMPLRVADLAENDQPAHMTSAAYVQSMRAYLDKAPARPASIETVVLSGQTLLRIEFTAPEPLGLLGPPKSH